MVNYKNGKIYKIVSDQTDKIYIGSTTDSLSRRIAKHQCDYKKYLNGNRHYISSFDILKYDDAKIYLIEDYPCERKEQLLRREGEYIKENKGGCVNNKIPGRTTLEYRQNTKDNKSQYDKKYYQKNKDKKIDTSKQWYEANKDNKKEYDLIYRQKNKDKISKQKQEWRRDNKDKINERTRTNRYICEVCNSELRRADKSRHERSIKHQQNLLN